MMLLNATTEEDMKCMIFLIVDQINHGSISDPTLRVKVAELNFKTAVKAMETSNCTASLYYSRAAIQLLPNDHWQTHYDLSKNIFLVIANAAYTAGLIKEATR